MKVGDKVKVVAHGMSAHGFNIGDIVKVVDIDVNDGWHRFNDGDCSYWMTPSEYEPIHETPTIGASDQATIDRVLDATTGPVITETVKRIVPGVYGKVSVGFDGPDGGILVDLRCGITTRDDLTEAIATLTAIRDAM